MTGTISPYRRKHVTESISDVEKRVTAVETNTNLMSPRVYFQLSSNSMPLNFQFQATHFTEVVTQGNARITSTTSSQVIDEETNAAVVAFATFDDVGGIGPGSVSLFDSTLTKVPMFDFKGKTAWYHGKDVYITWSTGQPQVGGGTPSGHLKAEMAGNSVMLNVPGNVADNTKSYCYYDSNTAFDISALPVSVALWFYPGDGFNNIGANVERYLMYRFQNATNGFNVVIRSDTKLASVRILEGGVNTQRESSNTVLNNTWNLIIFTYNPATNALVTYLNNNSASNASALTAYQGYTANSNMYLGQIPGFPQNRFGGNLDNFVFWSNKILTATEATNYWTHGTII